jgi:hypothetical protein
MLRKTSILISKGTKANVRIVAKTAEMNPLFCPYERYEKKIGTPLKNNRSPKIKWILKIHQRVPPTPSRIALLYSLSKGKGL